MCVISWVQSCYPLRCVCVRGYRAVTSLGPSLPSCGLDTNQPQVKEKTFETISMHTELYQLFCDKWRLLTCPDLQPPQPPTPTHHWSTGRHTRRMQCTPSCTSSSVPSVFRPPALTSNHPNHPNQHTNQPQVKEKTHETIGVHTELYQLFSDKWRSLLGRCSSNYISDAKLGQLLKQWAGEDDKQENKGETEDMSKLLTVLNEVTEMGPRALECLHANFRIRVSNPCFHCSWMRRTSKQS